MIGWGMKFLQVSAIGNLGRDGSPSRPIAVSVTYLHRPNGGLGEPALPKTGPRLPIGFPVSLCSLISPTASRFHLILQPTFSLIAANIWSGERPLAARRVFTSVA